MIVNCTKQDIMVIKPDGEKFHIPPSGIIPWLDIENELVAEVEVGQGVVVPIYRERLVSLQNIPDEEDDTWYIVPAKVADYLPEREDFIVPNLLKDTRGRALGITSFRQKRITGEWYGE